MRTSDFDYHLPEALIAMRPVRPRAAARLMVLDGAATHDARVGDLPGWLRPGDLLVLNDTRVIPARLTGERVRATADGSGRARVEVTLMRATASGAWEAMAKPLRRLREGDVIAFDGAAATVVGRDATRATLRFDVAGGALDAVLARSGAMPLPPYIAARRAADAADREDYQTVWADRPGAVAAPTASLHLDEAALAAIGARGVRTAHVTLHVGAGTFLPVTEEDPSRHRMHAEWGEVGADAAEAVARARAAGGRVIALGTTALRVLETAARAGDGTVVPWAGDTDIFIVPGHRFLAVDGLVTNFHLPRSTLLMLVSALMGRGRMLDAYAHAVREGYRFLSYGDTSLLLPGRGGGIAAGGGGA